MVNLFKERLFNDLGKIGSVFAYLLTTLFTLYPLFMCHLPWWANLIILFLIYFTDAIGGLLSLGIWIWSFVIVVSGSIGVLEIIYFVLLGLYAMLFFAPALITLVSSFRLRSSTAKEEELKEQWAHEQDNRIANMKIPNPYRPGNFFYSMDELEEYAEALHRADAERRAQQEAEAQRRAEAARQAEARQQAEAENKKYYVVDTDTGEVVGETDHI